MKYQGKVEGIDFFANGILHLNGKCCFIKNALPGEEIRYEIGEEKKRYAFGETAEILFPSFHRLVPPCSSYGECGGCDFQHMHYDLEIKAKEAHIRRNFKQIVGAEAFELLPIEKPKKIYGYRNHMSFHLSDGKIGFYRQKSHSHIPVSDCDLAEPALKKMIYALKDFPLKEAESVVLRTDNCGNRIAVIYGERERDYSALIEEKDAFGGIVAVSKKGIKEYGAPNLCFDLDGKKFCVPPQGFFQINTEAALMMLRFAKDRLKDVPHKRILDLYCGVGSIGQYLADPGDEVFGIEVVKEAVEAARNNAECNQIKAIYRSGKTEYGVRSFLEDLPRADLVVVDPPRQGLQKDTAAILADYAADHLLYISCDPASLSRDLAVLLEKYRIEWIKPFDLFPRTSHVETIVLMIKK